MDRENTNLELLRHHKRSYGSTEAGMSVNDLFAIEQPRQKYMYPVYYPFICHTQWCKLAIAAPMRYVPAT